MQLSGRYISIYIYILIFYIYEEKLLQIYQYKTTNNVTLEFILVKENWNYLKILSRKSRAFKVLI